MALHLRISMEKLIKIKEKGYKVDGEFYISEDESHIIYRDILYNWYNGYYLRTNKAYSNSLHRAVWIDHFGPIPKGYHIHHKDANRRNNHIENLQCLERRIHLSRSAKNSTWVGSQDNLDTLAAAREKGKKWHSTEEGLEWHRQNALKLKPWLIVVTFPRKCEQCGNDYQSRQRQGRFCSPKCKSNFRYQAGVDNDNRRCIVCEKYFTVNRHMPTQTCSRTCTVKFKKQSNQINRTCVVCSKEFVIEKYWKRPTCSRKCCDRFRKINKSSKEMSVAAS